MKNCYLCGSEMENRREEREILIGNRSAVVPVQFHQCPDCREEVIHPDQMDHAQREASRLIREEEGLLQPGEIREIREGVGLTQAAFEDLLRVGRKTVVRWERGTVYQSKATDTLLKLIAADPENARRLARWHSVELPQILWAELERGAVATYMIPSGSMSASPWRGTGRVGPRRMEILREREFVPNA